MKHKVFEPTSWTLFAVTLLVVAAESVHADCQLYGVYSAEVEGDEAPPEGILRIDEETGIGSLVGPLDLRMAPFGLAALGDELYTFDQIADVIRRLDPANGQTVETIDVGIREIGEGSIAIRGDAVGFISGTRNLHRFDLASGTSSVVGPLRRMDGLTIGPNGLLYGLEEASYNLIRIDPQTAEAMLVGRTGIEVPSFNFTGGLALGPDGNLYAANGTEFYRLDPATAETTRIDFVGWFSIHGLAFVDCHPVTALQPGDADQNLEFASQDIVEVLVTAKYLTGQSASWGEGDWNGAPGGRRGRPPQGNGVFDQNDILASLRAGLYQTGPYAALEEATSPSGVGAVSVGYDWRTGDVWLNTSDQLTSILIQSSAGVLDGLRASHLSGSFDHHSDTSLFKATLGASFGSIRFGQVASEGLREDFLVQDLSITGTLAGGGVIGEVHMIVVPEPHSVLSFILGTTCIWFFVLMSVRSWTHDLFPFFITLACPRTSLPGVPKSRPGSVFRLPGPNGRASLASNEWE